MTSQCADCGARTEPGEDFCGECGAYLDWHAAEETATVDEPPVAAPDVPEEEPDTEAASTPEPRPDPPPDPEGAAALVVRTPPAPPPNRAPQPAPVQPGTPAPRPSRRTRSAEREPLHPGDLICGSCGAGNKATRKFCRRCGETLAEAEVVTLPWWRRVFRRRRKAAPREGTRPRTRRSGGGRWARRGVALAVLVAIVVVGFAARGALRGAYDTVLDRIVGTDVVDADSVRGSSDRPGHEVSKLTDHDSGSYWSPTGDGADSHVVFHFAEPHRIVYLVITPGASATKEQAFRAVGRPRSVAVTLVRSDGSTHKETLSLDNARGPTQFDVATDDVEEVRLRVVRVRSGDRPDAGTAVAEVEFRGRD